MKCALVLLALCALAFAQRDPFGNGESLARFIDAEVHALVAADSTITLDTCISTCDSDFVLHSERLEHETDVMCRSSCERALRN